MTIDSLSLAKKIREDLAKSGLLPPFAKLYSHYSRLRANMPGLFSWRDNEFDQRLEDVLILIESALIEKNSSIPEWHNSMRRAGELLEWLSHPLINLKKLPIHLLSSAAYQLAGYPARALGLLNDYSPETDESLIIRCLLIADFPLLTKSLIALWAGEQLNINSSFTFDIKLQKNLLRDLASALGVLIAYFRWGDIERLDKAIEKIKAIGKVFIYSQDTYSWLLAKLCSEIVQEYKLSSVRCHIQKIKEQLNKSGKKAIERYVRQCYKNRKVLFWLSQIQGIENIVKDTSFALCTPTGSGKTTVAELAILQSLFKESKSDESFFPELGNSLVIYLVPSRALAAEVESKLSQVLSNISEEKIVVTGLYGGTDWGPTDSWLTTEERTVLICTYEKAEALVRFVGPFFLHRVKLIVIDEAHRIQFDNNNGDLIIAENRSLRLESLIMRLSAHLERKDSRLIALSAVASGSEQALAGLVTGNRESIPITTNYRSTRQLIGRLECLPNGRTEIRYDLLDGALLKFNSESSNDGPYVSDPIPPYPSFIKDFEKFKGPEKALRPYFFWAAIHFASPGNDGHRHSVLISIAQLPEGYGKDFLYLLEEGWKNPLCSVGIEHINDLDKTIISKEILEEFKNNGIPLSINSYIEVQDNGSKWLIKDIKDKKEYQVKLENKALNIYNYIPSFFQVPHKESAEYHLWQNCLLSCEDYFGNDSIEYRLLEKGIVLHHGKMPGIMGRLLVQLIEQKVVNVVLATSTLSDGINLPFETVLIPTLKRYKGDLTVQEFTNLAGRAGRPGVGTEGKSLVLLLPPQYQRSKDAWSINSARDLYFNLIENITKQRETASIEAESPLAHLIKNIYIKWRTISNSQGLEDFLDWIERISPLQYNYENFSQEEVEAIDALDTLDLLLLSAMVEFDILEKKSLTLDELENVLKKLWQKTYAYFSKEQTNILEKIFVKRGLALEQNIYPDKSYRKKLYHTTLPPRSGQKLLDNYDSLKLYLQRGAQYAEWDNEKKLDFIKEIIKIFNNFPKFKLQEIKKMGGITWEDILNWWLNPANSSFKPNPSQISRCYDYISSNFNYKFNWGLGCFISIAMTQVQGEEYNLSKMEEWPQTGLPWIIFWLKELITWGTLDPVASYLLCRGIKFTRKKAEKTAKDYYLGANINPSTEDPLNAIKIRDWVQNNFSLQKDITPSNPPEKINVELLRDFSSSPQKRWRVFPVIKKEKIRWYDPAGFDFAVSDIPNNWQQEYLGDFDFILNVDEKVVISERYI